MVAERAVETLRTATSFVEAEIAWFTFLMASHAIYTKLDAGALTNGKEGYCIDETASRHSKVITMNMRIEDGTFKEYDLTIPCVDGEFLTEPSVDIAPEQQKNIIVIRERRRLVLLTAYDRKHGDSFDPPKMHFGKNIEDFDAFQIAELAHKALITLVNQAEALQQS